MIDFMQIFIQHKWSCGYPTQLLPKNEFVQFAEQSLCLGYCDVMETEGCCGHLLEVKHISIVLHFIKILWGLGLG